jgi:acyl carrier protein
MTSREAIISRIEPIIRDLFDKYEGPVTEKLSPNDVAQWDSLGNVQLLTMAAKKFGITFTSKNLCAPENVGSLADLISSKLAAPNP